MNLIVLATTIKNLQHNFLCFFSPLRRQLINKLWCNTTLDQKIVANKNNNICHAWICFRFYELFQMKRTLLLWTKVQPSMIWFLELINLAHYNLFHEMCFEKESILCMKYIFEQFGQYCNYQHYYWKPVTITEHKSAMKYVRAYYLMFMMVLHNCNIQIGNMVFP